MYYSEGESFELSDSSWIKLSVGVDDSDFAGLLHEWFPDVSFDFPKMPVSLEFDCLTYLASKLIVSRRAALMQAEITAGIAVPDSRKSELVTKMQRMKTLGETMRARVEKDAPRASNTPSGEPFGA
jgi:hypothetical protein